MTLHDIMPLVCNFLGCKPLFKSKKTEMDPLHLLSPLRERWKGRTAFNNIILLLIDLICSHLTAHVQIKKPFLCVLLKLIQPNMTHCWVGCSRVFRLVIVYLTYEPTCLRWIDSQVTPNLFSWSSCLLLWVCLMIGIR